MTGSGPGDDSKLSAHKSGATSLPDKHWLWPLYGSGVENLGVGGRPIQAEMPVCGPDDLLVRHDAVGLCFSDTKVIKAGAGHPRLGGRDMRANPVVLGHEVALTVVQVGEHRRDQFSPGDRFIIQADIYYKGQGLAYGYALQGGLSQYNVIGKEILEGDGGCYLIPVQPGTGYAQAALTEPWACVTASYDIPYRVGWKPAGIVLIAAGTGALEGYELRTPYSGGQPPSRVITLGVRGSLLDELLRRSQADGFSLVELRSQSDTDPSELAAASGADGYDDIVLLGADVALYEALQPLAAKGCVISLVGGQALGGVAQVDVGRLHYDSISLTGTAAANIAAAAYEPIRTELTPRGRAAFLGAAGPMGQMHVQRALQADAGPSLIAATDLDAERLAVLETKYAQLIEAKRGVCELVLRVPGDSTPEAFNADLLALTGGHGYDDIVVLAPSPRVVAGAVPLLAPGGVMNIFAGLVRGTMAPIEIGDIPEKGIRFTGSSGSAIHDLRAMLTLAEGGRLDPNLSVAAVSGLSGVKQGLEGVIDQGFPGKVVIYPQILEFPVTALEGLKDELPGVYAKLGPNHSWTAEAEAQFLRELLP